MFDTHERILQRLHASGQEQFSVEMIRGIIDTVETEEIDRMYEEYLRHEEDLAQEREQWRADENTIDRIERQQYEAESQPTNWKDAAEGLDEIPFPELAQDREMEW